MRLRHPGEEATGRQTETGGCGHNSKVAGASRSWQRLEEAAPGASERHSPAHSLIPDLRFRIVAESISVVLSPWSVVIYYGSPRNLMQ